MREAIFRSELVKSIRSLYPGVHCQVIPDSPFTGGTSFQHKKPYDVFALQGGNFHAMELKQQRKGLSLPLSRVEEHQQFYLQQVEHAGGFGWVVVNYRTSLSERQRKVFGTARLNKAFMVRWSLVSEMRASGKTGLRVADLMVLADLDPFRCVEVPRIKKEGMVLWGVQL